MGSKERRDALKAASAYYGFSSASGSLPDTVDASVYTVLEGPEPSDFLADLETEVERAWSEHVGAISRTARLGDHDFAHIANRLRDARGEGAVTPGSDEVREWMTHLVGDGVCLVEIDRGDETKHLLVNTAMSS